MHRITVKILRGLMWVVVVVLLLAGNIGLGLWWFGGDQLLSVQNGSMMPVLHRGDAVGVEKVPTSSLRVGQIISYISSINPRTIITHRLVRVDPIRGIAITKSDAIPTPDRQVPLRQVLGRARVTVPKLGFVIDAFQSPVGLAIAMCMPAAFVVAYEVRRLIRRRGRHRYRLPGHGYFV